MSGRAHDIRHLGLSGVARDILAYLEKNADARDTLEGVAEWWLLDQKVDRELERVEAALEKLVEADLVEARRTADGRLHYLAKKGRTSDDG